MRDRDPHILIDLVGIAWRQACFGSECELGDAVCPHLLGV